jgi:hypothetical protein
MTNWARCNFDGRPVSPGDQKVISDYAAFLSARKAGDRALQWLELAQAENGGPYWRAWYCRQPPLRRAWRVTDYEWAGPGPDGLWTQRIRAIELAPIT